MKKNILLILLFIVFLPISIKAETCDTSKVFISSITMQEKSDNVEEIEKATASGKNINLNLSMSEVGDNIEYKITVKNESEEDYELDKKSISINSDYIDYSFDFDNKSNIIKANSSKPVYLKIEYKNEVPANKYNSLTFNDKKTITIPLSSGNAIKISEIIINPETGLPSYFLVITTFIIAAVIYTLIRKKKYTKYIVLVVGLTIVIPITVYALCKYDIKINSDVEIKKIYNGTGIIYTDKMFGTFNSDWTYPKTGERFSFLTEIAPVPKWCSYIEGYQGSDNELCVYDSKEACLASDQNTFCLKKADDSWNSCIDEGYSLDEHSCNNRIQIEIEEGYAYEGEYICEANDKISCKLGSVLEGDYTIFRNLIENRAYYKYETENYIITKTHLCFTTDKEYCYDGETNNFQKNISLLKEQQEWFINKGGSCTIDETTQYGRCISEDNHISVIEDEVYIYYQEHKDNYLLNGAYCVRNGESFCEL